MDKTVSYVNYQPPDQLTQILKILNKSILFFKKLNFKRGRQEMKCQKSPPIYEIFF